MTEAEWFADRTEPVLMVARLDQQSQRKLRLLACALCREIWAELLASART